MLTRNVRGRAVLFRSSGGLLGRGKYAQELCRRGRGGEKVDRERLDAQDRIKTLLRL